MKKSTLILLTILALALTACGASTSTEAVSSTQADPASGSLDGATLLLLGTLKLEGTENAVTPGQAKELLPLWQVYQEISTSSTSAQAEIDALEKQIEENMTSTQMKAIREMNLTPQDSFAVMQELGIGVGMGQRPSSTSEDNGNFVPGQGMGGGGGVPPDMGGTRPGMGAGQGGGIGGQVPDGAQMPDYAQGLDPEQMATAQASGSQTSRSNMMLSALLNAIIQYLEELAAI